MIDPLSLLIAIVLLPILWIEEQILRLLRWKERKKNER